MSSSDLCKLFLGFFSKRRTVVPVKAPIKPFGVITIHEASSILLYKLADGDKARIYLPDTAIKVYRKSDVQKSKALEEIIAIKYVAEEQDCDDFAAELFGEFAGLVWTMKHALNWFIDEHSVFWFIEPQTGKMAEFLEDWQGFDVRFFLGR